MNKMETTKTKENKNTAGKILKGVIVSDKMKDTVVVLVERYVKHPKYGKYIKKSKKYKADDKGNTAKMGDKVMIVETKPISKDKHFKILKNE